MLTGEPLRFAHRRIQSCPAFDNLDARLQALLRDMLETDSADFLDRFDKVIPRLESLKGRLPAAARARRRRNRRIAWLLAAGLGLLGAAAAAWFLLPPI